MDTRVVILTHVHCILHKFVFIIFEGVTAKKTPQKFYRREVTAQTNVDYVKPSQKVVVSFEFSQVLDVDEVGKLKISNMRCRDRRERLPSNSNMS